MSRWELLWSTIVVVAYLTALAYLAFRGPSMAERRATTVSESMAAQQEYIKSVVAATTPADQIARAKGLPDAGTISREEFDTIKAKALA